MFENILTFLACLIGMCPQVEEPPKIDGAEYQNIRAVYTTNTGQRFRMPLDRSTLPGNYLTSRFAQRNHDWDSAAGFTKRVAKHAPNDLSLKKRLMVLSMGAGQYEIAIKNAQDVLKAEPDNALALLFAAMPAFKTGDYQSANALIDKMPTGSLSAFILPLLKSWSAASLQKKDIADLNKNIIHIYHAILIADYLNAHDDVKAMLARALKAPDLSTRELFKIASVYAHLGDFQQAKVFAENILSADPNNIEAAEMLEDIEAEQDLTLFKPVTRAEDGISRAMLDMARILYSDYSDESARIFGQLALYLNPDSTDSIIMLGHIAGRHDRFNEAIAFYKSVPPDHPYYFDARRLAADLLEDQGRIDEALSALQALVETHDNIDALIQIGDLHRRAEDFDAAILSYNQAEKRLGGVIPKEHWQLHYVRGMSYEQLGVWDKAEIDLQAALAFQPHNPYVLNYLGYSWADQGIRLEESLDMIRRAVNAQPDDGYITDSLGWVLYRMGRYAEAIEPLERAVQLMPYDATINDHLGDAYWKVGRRLEAQFQWERAKNHSDDNEMITSISQKLEYGLNTKLPETKAADAEGAIDEDALSTQN